MSVLFALLAAVGWGSSDFAAGHASRRSSAVSVVILTHLASVVTLVGVSLLPGQGGSPTVADLLWGLAAGLGGGFGAMLLFRGLGKGSMSVVAPVTATGAATIPVAFGLVQGESITALGLVGIVLALVAIVMVSLSAEDEAGDDAERTATEPATAERRELVLAGAAPSMSSGWAAPTGAPAGSSPPPPVANAHPTWAELPPPPPDSAWALGEAPLRRIRVVVTTLMGTAVLAAAGIAAGPVADLTAGEDLSFAHTATLVFAMAILGLASVALSQAKPMFDFVEVAVGDDRPAGRRVGLLSKPGLPEALLSGVGFGLFFVFIAETGEDAGHWPLVSARFISVVMFAAGAILATIDLLPERPSRKAVVIAGVLDAAAAVAFVLSTRSGLLSVGAVLASLYPAVTVLLARVIAQERITRRQLVGLVLAGCAISLIALR